MLIMQDIAILGWVPIVLFIFASYPPRRAALMAYLIAWLFLPNNAGYRVIPHIPMLTKMSAAGWGVLLGALIFDSQRLFAFRPRWFDIPMAVWCLCPFASSLSSDLGLYDGFSVAFQQTVLWGFPYFCGRIYFNDLESIRELAWGILIGGLVYVPLCFIDIRMSPGYLHRLVYGDVYLTWWEVIRYGSWRPMVFMQHGLMLGLWMAVTAVIGLWFWLTKVCTSIYGYRMGYWVLLLAFTEWMCVSTGALVIFALVCTVLFIIHYRPNRLVVIALLLIAPCYMLARGTGYWDGQNLVSFANNVDEDRSASLDARRAQEDGNLATAREHLAFGIGTWTPGADQFWILAIRNHGLTGLISVSLSLLLPLLGLLRTFPPSTWKSPQLAPVLVLCLVVVMFVLDILFNAMYNPIYVLTAGGLSGFLFTQPRVRTVPRPSPVRRPAPVNRGLPQTAG